MPVRGQFSFDESSNQRKEMDYEVVQWHSAKNDRTYESAASEEKLRSGDAEWIRVKVTDPDRPDNFGRYVTFYGPFSPFEYGIELELEAMWEGGDYSVENLAS